MRELVPGQPFHLPPHYGATPTAIVRRRAGKPNHGLGEAVGGRESAPKARCTRADKEVTSVSVDRSSTAGGFG
jgi:hypothetical protein